MERVVVLWKETREARRAIEDSIGLLKQARHVDVVEVSGEDDVSASRSRLDDIIAWLAQHEIPAEPHPIGVSGDEAVHLRAILQDRGADLVVAGAYGHSRLREWVFGGVTRDLLLHSPRCSFLSH